MAALLAMVVLVFTFWHAWALLAARTVNAETIAPLTVVTAAAAAPMAMRLLRRQPLSTVPILPLIACLAAYVAACVWAPPLARIAVAAITILFVLCVAGRGSLPQVPFLGLALLALPVLPTFEFYFAYPMRLASAAITVQLLGMQGLAAVQDGLALRVDGRLFEFDAPCAGVHMLWAGCFLASAVALLQSVSTARYIVSLVLAAAFAVVANAVRAASLVYVEAGVFPLANPDWVHPAAGVAAFVMSSAALLVCMQARNRGAQ